MPEKEQKIFHIQPKRFIVYIVLFSLLLGMIAHSPDKLVYDERYHIENVLLLKEKGLSVSFLRSMKHSPGPLYATLHYLFEPVTGLNPKAMRFCNLALFLIMISLLIVILKEIDNDETALETGFMTICAPGVAVLAGLALTETPAMCFLVLSIYCLRLSVESKNKGSFYRYFWALVGGLFAGVSILGRQPFLSILLATPFYVNMDRSGVGVFICFVGACLFVSVPVFFIWHGLTPPSVANLYEGKNISLKNGWLACIYSGIITLFLAPRWFSLKIRYFVLLGIVAFVLNLIVFDFRITPMKFLMERHFSPSVISLYTRTVSSGLFCLAVFFLASTIQNLIIHWQNNFFRFSTIGFMLLLSTTVGMVAQFSSRYVVVGIPLIVLMLHQYINERPLIISRSILGGTIGLLSLASYYQMI